MAFESSHIEEMSRAMSTVAVDDGLNWNSGGPVQKPGDFMTDMQHADDGFGFAAGGDTGDGGCRNCGEAGHFARDCDKPKQLTGACFNCGEIGHNKADCPKPRVFTGTCHICDQPNHSAAECPQRPPKICKNCGGEGHFINECKNDRANYLGNVEDKSPEDAWEMLTAADAEKDITQFRTAVMIYAKAIPDMTFLELENSFRSKHFNTYIIAIEADESKPHTIINLQGRMNCRYVVQFSLSPYPKRKATAGGWPPSPAENLKRLEDAGVVEDRGVPKCTNCGEFGHISKFCKEDKREVEMPRVMCVNCGGEGHRARDCSKERIDPNVCRNCKKPGHRASDCEEPRSAEGVQCKKCDEMGHFARDCPTGGGDRTCRNCGKEGHIARECEEPRSMTCRNCGEDGHMARDCEKPRDPATMTCHNCDQGHMSRECPKPRDYSRVVCRNCGEKGHTVVRCTRPPAETEATGDDAPGGGGWDAAAGNGWDEPSAGGTGW